MKWRWPPWRAHPATVTNTGEEADAAMTQLERRDQEVAALSKELREAQHRNHFSIMVNEAIARSRER